MLGARKAVYEHTGVKTVNFRLVLPGRQPFAILEETWFGFNTSMHPKGGSLANRTNAP